MKIELGQIWERIEPNRSISLSTNVGDRVKIVENEFSWLKEEIAHKPLKGRWSSSVLSLSEETFRENYKLVESGKFNKISENYNI